MTGFPHFNKLIQAVHIVGHETDPNLRCLQSVGRDMNDRFKAAGWHHVGTSLSGGESGSGHVRVSPIDARLKSSYGYYWCVGVAGFGHQGGEEKSFLSHGQDNLVEQETHLRNAIRRLLDICGVETTDFILFGGQNNLPDSNHQDCTLRHSAKIRVRLAQIIDEETQGRIRPVIIPPAIQDNRKTDSMGKSVLVETQLRTLHVFERLIVDSNPEAVIPPEKRAFRYQS